MAHGMNGGMNGGGHGGGHGGMHHHGGHHGNILMGMWMFGIMAFPALSRAIVLFVIVWLLH